MSTNSVAAPKTTPFRKEFVQFLFSLCVAQIAVFVAAFVATPQHFDADKAAVWTHLLLALIVVWTSWFGWRRSVETQVLDESGPFKRAAMLALLDIVLVVMYFVLIRSVELTNVEQGKKASSFAALESASARPESRVLLVVFGTFLIWDVVSKGRLSLKFWSHPDWKWPVPSVIALLCTGYVHFAASGVRAESVRTTVLFDMALICVVLLFRQAKEIQNLFLAKRRAALDAGQLQKLRNDGIGTLVLSVLFVTFLVLAMRFAMAP